MGEKGPFQMGNSERSGFGGYSGTKKSQLCLNITIYFCLFFFFLKNKHKSK